MKTTATILFAFLATTVSAQTNGDEVSARDSVFRSVMLEEVKVTAPPKTRMKGNSMVTRVVGTAISTAGNAEDVLARIPGMMKLKGELQVIGKGAPVYYINGRKVSDLSELQSLSSHDIKNVEVIANPGAQYDAQANAVVRINTVRRRGEGFGMSVDANGDVAPSCGNERFNSTLNMNYRLKDTDFFGGVTIDAQHLNHYDTESSQTTFGSNGASFSHGGTTHLGQRYNTLRYNIGMNTMFGTGHSAGFRIERTDNLKGLTNFLMSEDVYHNAAFDDHLVSETDTDADGQNSWLLNAYYNGKVCGWGIDFNIDFYTTDQTSRANTVETDKVGTAYICSESQADSRMLAMKLVASRQIWHGNLQLGVETAFARRDNVYQISEVGIADDKSDVVEDTYALFAEYGAMIPRVGMLSAGLRYEHVDFTYTNHFLPSENLLRRHDNLFPFLSFGTRLGKIDAQLSYSLKTRRPNYYLLRSNIEYNNRYTLSTGDPKLENEMHHDISLNLRYNSVGVSLQYMCMRNGIYDWTYPYDDEGRVLLKWVNFTEPIHRIGAFFNASPTFGVWSPNYTLGIQKQWLEFSLPDPREAEGTRLVCYNKPLFIFNANNAFRLPESEGGWQFEVNSELLSGGHYGNAELRNWYWNLSCSVQKYFLKDKALSVRLAMNDIFHTAYNNVRLDLGNYLLTQSHILGQGRGVYDLQRVSLTLRYNLNLAKSKYKGTGAGKDVRERM